MENTIPVDIVMKQPPIKCEECGGIYFEQLYILKKVNKLLIGTNTDEVFPFVTYRCNECKHINKEFKIFEDGK